ncbi:PTS sugar transporter subunit IIB [Geosporobacter ferrireducens]|uniref:PTS sugar transporter subunit IIB n=1 Tax=Geosporobacter ferrireducens TaxID=1424294 RepID=A0A1D8GCK0_9FIRM|nr:PTS sugar transporter subunit IIB [Geosporobacter ferrireducens]AOT68629.1 PTS sugar transporter subunit IIB [Geosporobacter ferrireducens]MTI54101.1 PTS sugar transporter subunit IIB [Geosporobacter ferrireducens]
MKIVLICYAGMSTSLLVNKMKKVAEERNLVLDIDAYAASEIHDVLDSVDVVLLGPQARYALNEVKKITDPKGIPAAVIDSVVYGLMNAKAVLDMALELIQNK